MHLYLKVVWTVFSRGGGRKQSGMFDFVLKGSQYPLSQNNHKKKFHLGIGQQFIRLISVLADTSQPSEKKKKKQPFKAIWHIGLRQS